MMKKYSALFLTATLALSLMPAALANSATQTEALYPLAEPHALTVNAFSDIANSPAKTHIEYLLGREIMVGYNNEVFRPTTALTNAEAITLLTKAFELEVGEATTQTTFTAYPNVLADKWYTDAYTAAINNNVRLSSDVKVNDAVTREQFAGWIIDQLDNIGPYPVIKMYIHIADSEQIDSELAGKVQTLLLTKLAELQEEQTFRPKEAITREEAAAWISEAVKFADQLREKQADFLTSDLPFTYKAESALTYEEASILFAKALKLEDADVSELMTASITKTDEMTREQFAGWLIDEFDSIAPYPVIMMFIHIADEQAITEGMSHKIHNLLLIDIAELNEDGKFRPQDKITGAEAVAWLEKSAEFAERLKVTAAELGHN